MKKILCLVVCAVFAAALPARAQSDEYRDAVAEMMELTGALRNADVVMTQMVGYLKTSAPSVSEAVWEKIISKFNEKMRARMVDIYVPIYSKYLTLADLRELNALYAKPVMRKAVGATPAIMQEGMSAGAALGQEIMTELQRELQAGGYEYPPAASEIYSSGEKTRISDSATRRVRGRVNHSPGVTVWQWVRSSSNMAAMRLANSRS